MLQVNKLFIAAAIIPCLGFAQAQVGGNAYVPTLTSNQALNATRSVNALRLPHWRNALAKVRAGTGRGKILFFGDSTTIGSGAGSSGNVNMVGAWTKSFPNQITKQLAAVGIADSSNSYLSNQNSAGTGVAYNSYDPRLVEGSGWADGAGFFIAGGTTYVSTGTGTLAFTPTGQTDTADVYWYNNNNAATATVNVNGGATLATLTASGTQSVTKTTVTFTKGANTINVVGGGATQFYMMGVMAYDSTTPAIDIIQAGNYGSTVSTWTSNSSIAPGPSFAGATGLLAKMAPDLVVVDLTINDANTGTTAASYTANLAILVQAIQANGADVLLVSGTPSNTSATGIATIVGAMSSYADSNGIVFLDVNARWVNYTVSNALGWFYTDGIHPNAIGYQDVAQFISTFLAGV